MIMCTGWYTTYLEDPTWRSRNIRGWRRERERERLFWGPGHHSHKFPGGILIDVFGANRHKFQ
jgi:hypothetical protein